MVSTEQEMLSPLYAVIDLGSNSFHMLVTRQLAGSVQVVDKVRRKVRLAAGLDENNILSENTIANGLECISFFAERLQNIPPKNIRIVATATLRLAQNRSYFIAQAENILGYEISLLSGMEEANNIYLGVAHTSCSADKRLVLDIGGASTEIIVGDGFDVKKAISLNIGCVTYSQKYFPNGLLNNASFMHAIAEAETIIASISDEYSDIGWQCVLGGSGTMQALVEILMYQQKPPIISLEFLMKIKGELLNFDCIQDISIAGLSPERSPVIVSGLAILIALFQQLSIKELLLSSGALREGLLYEMLPDSRSNNIQQRTVGALLHRFHIDKGHANNVKKQFINIFEQLSISWSLTKDNTFNILLASCDLHEIGLLVGYKDYQQHGAYLLTNADLVGFNYAERQLLVMFVKCHRGDIDQNLLAQQSISTVQANKLLICLRLAVILCGGRQCDALLEYKLSISKQALHLSVPQYWLQQHPLIVDQLNKESIYLDNSELSLVVTS